MTHSTELASPLTNPPRQRQVELDWLRVLAFGLLIFYHTGMLYVQDWDWHYKSQYTSEFLQNIMLWSGQWRMSLLFLISGTALSFILARYPRRYIIKQRLPLLALPWLFGMLVVVVPQVYIEANSTGVINCSNYWHFWYAYLDQTSPEFADHKTLGKMHLTWNHLWFLPYLLAYTLIVWVIYPVLTHARLLPIWQWFKSRVTFRVVVLIPMLVFYLNGFFLYEKYPVTHNFVVDWFNHGRYFFCFLLGVALIKMPEVWNQLSSWRWHLLTAALISYGYTLFAFHGGHLGSGTLSDEFNGFMWSANSWLWMLTIIALVQRWFTHSNPIITYVNKGVYCFYILHQTLIIVIAYFLTPFHLGPVVEPLLVIASVMLGCVGLYELIKRLPMIPILFGIPKQEREVKVPIKKDGMVSAT